MITAHLEGEFDEMESRLVYLETLCSQCDQQTFKKHHMDQLENYKKKKRYDRLIISKNVNSCLICIFRHFNIMEIISKTALTALKRRMWMDEFKLVYFIRFLLLIMYDMLTNI